MRQVLLTLSPPLISGSKQPLPPLAPKNIFIVTIVEEKMTIKLLEGFPHKYYSIAMIVSTNTVTVCINSFANSAECRQDIRFANSPL